MCVARFVRWTAYCLSVKRCLLWCSWRITTGGWTWPSGTAGLSQPVTSRTLTCQGYNSHRTKDAQCTVMKSIATVLKVMLNSNVTTFTPVQCSFITLTPVQCSFTTFTTVQCSFTNSQLNFKINFLLPARQHLPIRI